MSSLKNLQLNWLRTFESVGRYLSFSSAAKRLNMSQSAVSQQISLLEHKVGKKLFVRRRRSIELTVAGRAYLGIVREGLQHVEHGMESIFNTVAEGVVELSVNNSFAQLWLAPRFKRFTALHPHVAIRVYGVNWEADAPPSSAELEIRYGRGVWAGFEATELLSGRMRPYCSRSTAIDLSKNGIPRNSTLIDVLGASVGWSEWLAKYPESGRDTFQRLHVDSFAIAADMAVHDVGVCLLYEELVAGSRLQDALFATTDQILDDQANFYLIRSREKSISGAAKAFSGWLQSEGKSPPSAKSISDPGLELRRTTRRIRSSARRFDS